MSLKTSEYSLRKIWIVTTPPVFSYSATFPIEVSELQRGLSYRADDPLE